MLDQSRLSTLCDLQLDILSKAVELVKDEGCIIYSTCSLSRLQNEDIVNKAIDKFKTQGIDLSIVDLTKSVKGFKELKEYGFAESELKGTIRILPNISCCGGMYIAKLIKSIQQ